jgi:hypothetical protein
VCVLSSQHLHVHSPASVDLFKVCREKFVKLDLRSSSQDLKVLVQGWNGISPRIEFKQARP